MAKYLPRLGVDVTVLTYRKQKELISFHEDVIGIKNVTKETVPTSFYFPWRVWQKGLRAIGIYRDPYGFWSKYSLKFSEEIFNRAKPDAILASYPTITALEIGLALAEKFNLPLISDFRDGLLFEPLEEEALKYGSTRLYYEEMEAKVVAASKLILTVSGPISRYFQERYAHANVVTLPNGFDSEDIQPDMAIELPMGVINIVHTGRIAISRKDDSENDWGARGLAAALSLMLKDDSSLVRKIKIHFVGQLSDPEKKCLAPFVEHGIVKLWGHQPRAKALGFQHRADVLLLITAPDKASIATGKLFEYLAAKKPILALTRGTEAARIVNETGVGIVVSPDNVKEIAATIRNCIVLSEMKFPQRNEALIAKYSRLEQMKKLANKLAEIELKEIE